MATLYFCHLVSKTVCIWQFYLSVNQCHYPLIGLSVNKDRADFISFSFCLDIDLKKAAKLFAQKYSCGSSVTGPDEIVIQGDVLDDLLDFIPEKWSEVILFIYLTY